MSEQTDLFSEFDRVQREISHAYWERMFEIERTKNTYQSSHESRPQKVKQDR